MKTIGFFGNKRSLLFGVLLAAASFGFESARADQIAAGDEFSAAIGSDGRAWSWGQNDRGQLGIDSAGRELVPHAVAENEVFESVAAGASHALGVTSDGRLFAWGRNSEGQLGLGDVEDRLVPVQVGSENEWELVSAGKFHSLGIRDGLLYAWGSNSSGQIGDNTFVPSMIPVEIGNGESWSVVAAGEFHSVAVRADGTLWAWGSNLEGQLGVGSSVSVAKEPVQIGSDSDWSSVAAGSWHTLAIRSDGSLWAWGRNVEGQLGLRVNVSRQATPLQVGDETDWEKLSAGGRHSFGLKSDGSLFAWGANDQGQLGDGTRRQRRVPLQIGSGIQWREIAAGERHSLFLDASGTVFASGSNSGGQLGDGTVDSKAGRVSVFPGLPDLEVTGISMPNPNPPSGIGAPFSMAVEGGNFGSGEIAAGTAFSISFRLTEENAWGEEGEQILERFDFADGLAIGETFSETFSISVPAGIPAGDYFIAVMLDEEGRIQESERENNFGWTEQAVPFLPDLEIDSAAFDETSISVEPGETVSIDLPVANNGTATLSEAEFEISLTLSGDGDLHLLNRRVFLDELEAGAVENISIDASVPLHVPPGSYQLLVELDPAEEIRELSDGVYSFDSQTAFIAVGGVSLADALDLPASDIVKNAGVSWFGREFAGLFEEPAAMSPSLSEGESVWFEVEIEEASTVTFRWKANTSDPSNRAVLTVNGNEVAVISGETDWERVQLDLAQGDFLRWSYEQGTENGGDFVLVEGLQITEQNLPDFAISGADYEGRTYVLQQEGENLDITATGINLGAQVQLPSDFRMSAYLSPAPEFDPGDLIDLGDLSLFRNLDSNNRFVYRSKLPLPGNLAAGAYHLVLILESSAQIDESDYGNNVFVSPAADILLERRANLKVVSVDYEPDLYLTEDELDFEVTIENAGLADVEAGRRFDLMLFLAADLETGVGEPLEMLRFSENFGIAAGETVTYEVRAALPSEVSLGRRHFVGAIVDVEDSIPESNESDNVYYSPVSDLIFAEVSMEEALDIVLTGSDDFSNGVRGMLPWFGQTAVTSDGEDAAQSPAMSDGEEAGFELSALIDDLTVVSFFWKVLSERVEFEEGEIKEDYLAFYIDGVEQQRISGEVEWRQESFVLQPGSRTLSWRYVKDGLDSAGLDTAWVDQIVYRRPDLLIADGPDAAAGNLFPGEPFTIDFVVANEGRGASPAFETELILSRNKDFSDPERIQLETFEIEGLAPGENRVISRTVDLPENMPIPGDYFIGVRVNRGFPIPESDETNNIAWSAADDFIVTVPVTLEDALDIDELNENQGISIVRGGDSLWYGQETEFDASVPGNVSAGKSPTLLAGEKAWFETTIPGPAVVDFRVKAETGHVSNVLVVSVDGSERASISGDEDWKSVRVLAPAERNVVRWSYNQENPAPGAVFVDRLDITQVDKPDFIIQSAEYRSGEYVLTRDRLRVTALGLNQGTFAQIDSNTEFDVKAKLVKENTAAAFDSGSESVDLGKLSKFSDLDADNRFVYQADLNIPRDTPAGSYFLALKIETEIVEFDDSNNYYFSPLSDVEIVRLPDLVVKDLTYQGGDFIYGDEIEFAFVIENQGEADLAATPFQISVLLTPNRRIDLDADDVLTVFTESSGLAQQQQRTYQGTVEIPDNVRTGEPLTLGVYVDSNDAVRESIETNNSRISENRDILVGELPIDVAIDNVGGSFDTSEIPWFGQRAESFDGEHAVKSGKIGDDQVSEFSTIVTLANPSIVSFYWKVSSERRETQDGGLKEDFLRFLINGEEQARISGEVDWTRVSFPIGAGSSKLSWEYVKDSTDSEGEDAGWVDRMSFELPDLIVEEIDYRPGSYGTGQELSIDVSIRNQGLTNVPSSRPFEVQVVLSKDLAWGNADDIALGSFTVSSLGSGETYSRRLNLPIPPEIPFEENYYVGVMVDATSVVVESNESNNRLFSEHPDIEVVPEITLQQALDDDEYPLDPLWIDYGWEIDGDKPWFGQGHRQLADGTFSTTDGEDAAQSGKIEVNQRSVLERRFEADPAGPSVVRFQWKVSSMPTENYLAFSISGKEMARISGETDWEEVEFIIPAGPQRLRWEYVKNNAQEVGEDAAFLDRVEIAHRAEANKPDLVITDVEFEPGVYVLQRDRLAMQVTVRNQGADLGEGQNLTPADLGIRLSADKRWGNSDDILLGNLARVDQFESGNRLVFSGEIDLPDHIRAEEFPDGEYYLAILVDPFEEIDELDRENNFFWSEIGAIEIRRLPNFDLHDDPPPSFDWTKVHYPNSLLKLDFGVVNRGLGDVSGDDPYHHEVVLLGREKDEENPAWTPIEWQRGGLNVGTLATIREDAYLPGLDPRRPDPHVLDYETHLMLPDQLTLLKSLGIIGADEIAATEEELEMLKEWEFALSIRIDVRNAIEESDEQNEFVLSNAFELHPLVESPGSFEQWAELYDIQIPSDSNSQEYKDLLVRYAFGMGPNEDGRIDIPHGIVEVGGKQYLRITFEIAKNAQDLLYKVEAGTLSNFDPILGFDLADEIDLSHPLILNATDTGDTLTITVRDSMTIDDRSVGFLRVVVLRK